MHEFNDYHIEVVISRDNIDEETLVRLLNKCEDIAMVDYTPTHVTVITTYADKDTESVERYIEKILSQLDIEYEYIDIDTDGRKVWTVYIDANGSTRTQLLSGGTSRYKIPVFQKKNSEYLLLNVEADSRNQAYSRASSLIELTGYDDCTIRSIFPVE